MDDHGDDTVVITKVCPNCLRTARSVVSRDGYERWRSGTLIQDAFPEMSAAQREMLLTGIHPECWHDYLGVEDD